MVANNTEIEKRLWEAADNLRANSKLRSSEYSIPVLGLIFLRYADHRFAQAEQQLQGQGGRRRGIAKTDFQAMGVMYLPETARFSRLMELPEGENIGKAINEAMKAIEDENEALRGVLPKQYNRFENDLLISLMKALNFPMNGLDGDVFGKIYEYFLGNFAMTEGQKGGEFFTPISIVKLIVEIIEPFHGYILDPACGSGGMFVQSAEFVKQHRHNPTAEIAIYGQERVGETVRLCKMNLAVHGLEGDIREGNTYYDDIHRGVGKFDFVMANAPRPVLELIAEDTRTSEEIEQDLMLEAQRNTVLLPGLSPLEPADIPVETEKPSLPADLSAAVETNTSVKITSPEASLEAIVASPATIPIDEPADDEPEPEALPPLPSPPSKFAAYQTLIQVVQEQAAILSQSSAAALSETISLRLAQFYAKHAGLTETEIQMAMAIGTFRGQQVEVSQSEEEAVPIVWFTRSDLVKRRPDLATVIHKLGDHEVEFIASKVGEALEEFYWIQVNVVLSLFLDHELQLRLHVPTNTAMRGK